LILNIHNHTIYAALTNNMESQMTTPLTKSSTFCGAFTDALKHPLQTQHAYVKNITLDESKKALDLYISTLAGLQLLCPDTFPEMNSLLKACKAVCEFGKLSKCEGSFYDLKSNVQGTAGRVYTMVVTLSLDGLTFGEAAEWTNKAGLTIAACTQTYLFANRYVSPDMCTKASVEFLSIASSVASSTGCETVASVAKAAVEFGAENVQNYTLIVCFVIQGAQAGIYVYQNWDNANFTLVGKELKALECVGKVVVLVAVVSGAGAPVIVGASIATRLVSLVLANQNKLPA
jgi:hypothetical protein